MYASASRLPEGLRPIFATACRFTEVHPSLEGRRSKVVGRAGETGTGNGRRYCVTRGKIEEGSCGEHLPREALDNVARQACRVVADSVVDALQSPHGVQKANIS
jgi:hypothetical protein